MSYFDYEDKLEVLGILVGAFVVVVGLGALSGLPWTTNENTIAGIIQLVGIIATIGVGVVLILAVYTGDALDSLPVGTPEEE